MPRATPHLEAIVNLVHIFWDCYILTCGASVVPFWCPVLGLKWLLSPALHPWALSLSRASEEQYHGNLKEACERGASLTAEGVKHTPVLVYACGSLCSVTPMTDIALFSLLLVQVECSFFGFDTAMLGKKETCGCFAHKSIHPHSRWLAHG